MAKTKAYAENIRVWCESMHCAPANNPEMVRDYIDHRWPTLTRSHRNQIFEAAVRPTSSRPKAGSPLNTKDGM